MHAIFCLYRYGYHQLHEVISKDYIRFVGKPRRIKLLGRPGNSLENNIEIGVRKLG